MFQIIGKKTKKSRSYNKVLLRYNNIDEVVKYVKEKNLTFSSPYIFTHLLLSDNTIITEEFNGIICSPIKLKDKLSNNHE